MPIDILGSITMMAIRVDDGNFTLAIRFPDKFNHYRFVVNVAETAVAMDHFHGMMPGWPDDGKGFINLFFHYQLGGFNSSSGGNKV